MRWWILLWVSLVFSASSFGQVGAATCQADSDLHGRRKAIVPGELSRVGKYLSSGVDMSYSPNPTNMGHSMFDNVFVNPDAYKSFLQTGTWPDKTMLVLEVRVAGSNASINKSGRFSNPGTDGTRSARPGRFAIRWQMGVLWIRHRRALENGSQRSSLLFVSSGARGSRHHVRAVLSHADWNCEGQRHVECGVSQGRSWI